MYHSFLVSVAENKNSCQYCVTKKNRCPLRKNSNKGVMDKDQFEKYKEQLESGIYEDDAGRWFPIKIDSMDTTESLIRKLIILQIITVAATGCKEFTPDAAKIKMHEMEPHFLELTEG